MLVLLQLCAFLPPSDSLLPVLPQEFCRQIGAENLLTLGVLLGVAALDVAGVVARDVGGITVSCVLAG